MKTLYEWYGETDSLRENPTGQWVIGAGATWDDAPSETDHADWFDRRYKQDFERSANGFHLFRYITPADLAKYATLDEQASALASWALETWALLDADPLLIDPTSQRGPVS